MTHTVSLHFKSYGNQGKNLVILHGFLGSLDNWHSLATQWAAKGLTVYALDLRNHGKSPHTNDHTIDLMAADVLEWIRVHQLHDVTILGHSMGGKVAMYLALNHPDSVQKLIVADIAPKRYKPGAHDDVFRAITAVNLSQLSNRKQAEQEMATYLGDFGTRQFVLKSLERTEEGNFRWKFNVHTLMDTYPSVLDEVQSDKPYQGPVLFLKGEQSLYIKPHDTNLIEHLFPNAQIVEIPNAGHWLHADNPSAFSDALLHFVNT